MGLHDENHEYWLFDWLEQRQITDSVKLRAAIDSRSVLTEMRDYALQWKSAPVSAKSECNLVAGSGLGSYDGLTCPNIPCRAQSVDVLYRHAWHYFDCIYVPDGAGDLLRNTVDALSSDELENLLQAIETSMYIRGLGAESLTRYYSSDVLSSSGTESFEGEDWDHVWEELAKLFLKHGERYSVIKHGSGSYEIAYDDPQLSFSPMLELDLAQVPKSQRRRFLRCTLTENMVNRHRRSFITNELAAQKLGGSLGSTIWSHQWVLSNIAKNTDEDAVFFRMDFPSLYNVPVADLITVRTENKDSFLACRVALRKAARELRNSSSADRGAIADEVVRDVVMPEMSRLSHRLEAAKKLLFKKSAIAVTVASVSTLCGLHFGAGMLTSLGAGTIAAFASGLKDAASKYSEEQRDLEISDMSFLWKAMACARKQTSSKQ